MSQDKIVQFVCFDTSLKRDQFIVHWEQYTRSLNSDVDVIMQQSEKNGTYRYIAQHRCTPIEVQFNFTKAKRSFHTPEVETRAKQAGGYLTVQLERELQPQKNEVKVFAFLNKPPETMDAFRALQGKAQLNIYEAYFENCQYAFILEYYVQNAHATLLHEQLKTMPGIDIGLYTNCPLPVKASKKTAL